MALFVANWKMYQPYEKALEFVEIYHAQLRELTQGSDQIILAPSFICLEPMAKNLKNTKIKLAAQDCAAYAAGSYTGEVDAFSLSQIGCAYGIVGHSERRQLCGETDDVVAAKATQLFENKIAPIICIGETKEQFNAGKTIASLAEQLAPLLPLIGSWDQPYCIAYEPVWSIGSGNVPTHEHLQKIFTWLNDQIKSDPNCTLLYGGSVDENNAKTFFSIAHVGGLLIGRASTDFQRFKKIVSLASNTDTK